MSRPAGPADGPARARAPLGWPDVLVGLALAAYVLVALALRRVPYQDTVNHLARYALLDRALSGTAPGWVQVWPLPTPYLGLDALGTGLLHTVGAGAAARVLGVAALVALPLGAYALLRAAAPAQRVWALAAVLTTYSWYFTNGMLNYQLGLGALFGWLAWWWPRRERPSARARVALGAGAAGLYFLHLSAACVALAVVGLDFGLAAVAALRGRDVAARRAAVGRAYTLAAAVAGVAAPWLVTALAATGAPGAAGQAVFRPLRSKVWQLTNPLYAFSTWELAVTGPALAVAAGAFAWAHRRRATINPVSAAVVLLALLYVVTPMSAGGPAHLDVRWVLPMYVLFFAAVPGSAARPPRAAVALLFAACLAHAATVWTFGRRIDRELAAYDGVLARVPADARVFPLVVGPPRYARTEPYLHYALWHTVEGGGRVGGMFSYTARTPGGRTYVFPQFAHFREVAPPYAIDERWDPAAGPALAWAEIARAYDYVVLAGRDSVAEAQAAAHGCRTARAGEVALYALGPACAPRHAAAVAPRPAGASGSPVRPGA